MKAPTKLAVAIALCLCILYACSANAAGVGGSTAGYMYIIEYDFSITQTPIDKKGMGTTKILVEKDNGGLYKQSIAVGPESIYWMAAPELPMGWQDYCIYEYSMQTGRIAVLACDLVEGEFNWPHNLYFSDEMNTLYWTAISDDPIAADSTLYYLNSTGDIESLIKRQPFWDPSGLVVTKDNHGDAVIAENTVGPVDDPLVWGQMGVYTWPYKQEASQTFYTSFQPYNDDFKTEFYFYFPGPMDIAYVDYNTGRNSTELYYATIYEGPNIKETPMFQISKVDLYSPVDNVRPTPRVVLDWTVGIPDTISIDPVNQQLFISFFLYSLQSPEARVSAISRVDVSGNLPSTMEVLSKESSIMYALENMRIRAL